MANFDLIVVGGGPGGYVAAIYGAQNGLKTALVEKDNLGGTCLNWGCIPTKALARNAEVLRTVNEAAEYGISLDAKSVKADYAAAQKRSREVSAKLVRGINGLMRKNKIEVIKGEGVLVSGTQVKVGDTTYSAKNIILATGSHPFKIPTIDYSNKNVMTSRQALELTDAKPGDKFVIIGAGAIGMEFASIWASYGVDVTVIEMLPRILPNEDADISAEVAKAFEKRGIKTMPGTKVVHVVAEGNDITVIVEKDGKRETLKCCKLLVSAGVRANVADIGLEAAGVKLTERGLVQVDENLRTTCPTVYAIGDITGKLALAHVASAQALAAVTAIVG